MSAEQQLVVSGAFDDLKSRDLRFLEESSKLGELTVMLWTDHAIQQFSGKPPEFPLAERSYFLNSVRYVTRIVTLGGSAMPDSLPEMPGLRPQFWADVETSSNPERERFCRGNNFAHRVFTAHELAGFREPPPMPSAPGKKKVVSTGCYDWFHSGHVRFAASSSEHPRQVCRNAAAPSCEGFKNICLI
jgi:glycerol-3-phosphate cytidylyltransferase-like family protein